MNGLKQNALPTGWTVAKLGDICYPPQYGWTTSASDEANGVRLLRSTDISSGSVDWDTVPFCKEQPPDIEKYRLHPDDIVITRTGVGVGNSFLLAECPMSVFASYLIRFRPHAALSAKYVGFFLKSPSYRELISHNSAGIAQPNVNAHKLALLDVPIAPRKTQEAIVAEIEKQFTRLDSAVDALTRAKADLKRYRAAVLRAACEGRLVPTEAELAHRSARPYQPAAVLLDRVVAERRCAWEEEQLVGMRTRGKPPSDDSWKRKYREPAGPDTADLPAIPPGWKWVTMPQLGELNRGKSKHRPRDDAKLYGGPYPFIQTGDVKRSGGYIREHTQTYSDLGLAQSRIWPAGTLCITIAANIAESGILTYPACFPDSVVGFVCGSLPSLGRYVSLFLETAKADLARFAPATAQKNINLETLSDLAIPLPPLAELERIVEEVEKRFSVIEEVDGAIRTDLKRAERLRQSILRNAFDGTLVPVDSNSEPASALVERIRAEGAVASARAFGRGLKKEALNVS